MISFDIVLFYLSYIDVNEVFGLGLVSRRGGILAN
jgi:hypothetical protein